jgi:hypothetical protein
LATGWGVVAPAPASAQCAFVVVRHDRAYFLYGSGRPSEIRPGAVLAETLEPGCSDVGGVPAPAPTPVRARRIAGVPPDVAVLVRGRALVAAGYLPRADRFPLNGITVDETKGCRPGAPGSLRGFARVWPAGIMLASGGEPIDVLVDVHTDVTGLSRRGLPYIGDGQRVRVDAVHCGRKIVARRIVANGRIVPATTAEDILGPDWRGGPSETSTSRHGWWAAGAASVTAAVAGGVLVLRRRPGAPHRS